MTAVEMLLVSVKIFPDKKGVYRFADFFPKFNEASYENVFKLPEFESLSSNLLAELQKSKIYQN